jgi:hypothetical protein
VALDAPFPGHQDIVAFFEATLGGIATTIAANQLLYAASLVMGAIFTKNSVFVVTAALVLVPVLPQEDESRVPIGEQIYVAAAPSDIDIDENAL